jgi:pyruvate dehydrogenase E1 component
LSYDPAYAYEIAVLVREGIRRMHDENEDVTFYLTVTNESYQQPPIPQREGVRQGIVKGMYLFRSADELGAEQGIDTAGLPRAQLLGSGAILNEALAAQELLLRDYGVAPDVWSVTSYSELRREAMDVDRWNWLHPSEAARLPYVTQMLGADPTLVVGATDYLKSLPDSIAKWVDAPLVSLGTDGFGRSATRAELRDFFEVDARHIAFATLSALVRDEALSESVTQQAMEDLKINPERANPATL